LALRRPVSRLSRRRPARYRLGRRDRGLRSRRGRQGGLVRRGVGAQPTPTARGRIRPSPTRPRSAVHRGRALLEGCGDDRAEGAHDVAGRVRGGCCGGGHAAVAVPRRTPRRAGLRRGSRRDPARTDGPPRSRHPRSDAGLPPRPIRPRPRPHRSTQRRHDPCNSRDSAYGLSGCWSVTAPGPEGLVSLASTAVGQSAGSQFRDPGWLSDVSGPGRGLFRCRWARPLISGHRIRRVSRVDGPIFDFPWSKDHDEPPRAPRIDLDTVIAWLMSES